MISFDLKNGPIKEIILLEIFDESLKPKILNNKKKNVIGSFGGLSINYTRDNGKSGFYKKLEKALNGLHKRLDK